MKMGKEMVARGEHEMGAKGAGSDDSALDDDDFDTDADATAAVDDMDIEDDIDETTVGSVAMVPAKANDSELDLNDIRDHYGVSEEDDIEVEPSSAMGGAESSTVPTYAGDEVSVSEQDVTEEETTYEEAIQSLIKLAGIATADTNIAEIKGKVEPKKGENVGFGMVDKDNLDAIIGEEVMDDEFIAKKVRDMGASLENQKDFIKHLAHVAKELKLGKYVMDNPDFVPDVMMAFKNLDEDEGCPCCGDGPCKCAPDCKGCDCASVEEGAGAVRGIAGAAKAGVQAAGTKMAINQVGDMMSSDDVDEGAEDLLSLFDLGDQETDEAIGDGFLSGNKALGAAMQDIEDEITETPESALEATIKELRALAGL